MTNSCPERSFDVLMKWQLLLILLVMAVNGFGQSKTVAGIVYDKDSRDRIASVNVYNVTNGISVYDNLTGGFKIEAKAGDKLVFSRHDFHTDTIIVRMDTTMVIYMAPLSIMLREVSIHDSTALNPDVRLAKTKADYSKIYGSASYRDFLSNPNNGPAGLSIDAIWNAFSRAGRNAARLQQTIEADYRQNVIDFRFNRTYVSKITGLKEQRLTDFMFRYRPGYYTVKTASEYDFIVMIRTNLKRYLRSPRTYSPPVLSSKE